MNILGINTGLGASVCLLSNGRVVICSRGRTTSAKKNCGGFPKKSLNMASEIFPLKCKTWNRDRYL